MREGPFQSGGDSMRVIVSFENRVRPDSTGVYMLRAFANLGHEVFHVLPENIGKVKKDDADFFFKCDDGMQGQNWNPELHPSAYYVIDTHIESDWRVKFASEGQFDIVTVAQPEGLSLPWTNLDVSWLPLGCDPEVHHVGEKEKIYDGCFIGNFHTAYASNRISTVDAFFKNCKRPYFGSRTFSEMAEKYAQSKLVLNQAINGDMFNMRFFEALCSGSCLVTERLKEGNTLGFVDGVHYAGYSSLDELGQVVKDLLENDDKREGIARNGRRAATQHTYSVRMKELLEKLPNTKELIHG